MTPVGGLKKRPITACLQARVRQDAVTRNRLQPARRWSPARGGNCASGLHAASVCVEVHMHWLHCGRLCAYRRQASFSQLCWACAGWLLCSSTGSVVCCWSVPASRVLSVWIAPMEQPRHRSSDRPVSRGASPAEGVISVISLTGARTTADRSRREVSLWCLSLRAPHPPVLRSRSVTDCRTCDRKLCFAVTCVGQQKEPWLLCCRLSRCRSVVDCRTGRRELCSRG